MTRPHLLVVGAGQAALSLACSLRDRGWDGLVTLVGDEAVGPYQRPPLSKGLLTGATGEQDLALRSPQFYSDHGIDVVLGDHVVGVERGQGRSLALTAAGRRIDHDHLVLATGARPRRLRVPGAERPGVVHLRTAADAATLRDRISGAAHLVVVGAGFIGLEVAATAAARGVEVTVVETSERILARAVSEPVSTWLESHHRSRGVTLLTASGVQGFEGDADPRGAVEAVRLADGTSLRADLVLVGVGAEPRVELARALGLDVAAGVVVDRSCRASDGATFAIGDCAEVLDPTPGAPDERVRLESVDHAVKSAEVVAAVLTGDPREYRCVPWFWSDQGTAKLQIVGLAGVGAEPVLRDVGEGKLLVGRVRDGHVVAVEALNAPADFMSARTLLGTGTAVAAADFVDPEWSLRAAAKAARGRSVSVA